MPQKPSQEMPPNGRLIAAGMAGAAAFGLLVNHVLIDSQHVARLMILCLGPIAFFLGLGGMIDPRILWSVGKYGKGLPASCKITGGVLGTAGVVVTILLLVFVYRLAPPEPAPRARPSRLRFLDRGPNVKSEVPPEVEASEPQRRVTPQDVTLLTYDRPSKRWVPMDEEALKGVRREDTDEAITLEYVSGEHPLLKVLWPDVLQSGDRFTVQLKGANSVEVVDVNGADANARTGLPASDTFIAAEIQRGPERVTFRFDGQSSSTYYASGKLRGDQARASLCAGTLQAAFTVKRGAQAEFRSPQIVKP